ncbi:alpha/beta hydrolase [Legionella brunensis]|uniref:Putative aminoacrylate hydrolase RutD n=1 Tax=Legionella brunensis TaxID=29422 RepID=A0A0W0S0N3_9GAMM|nr:alpha/beta hydrolase [Legionella brunensis]KTC76992.1 putative aminoacrylate hydrolase RutD [Legionella brunensis]
MIKQLLFICIFVLLIAFLLIYFFQRNLLYFPAKEVPSRKIFQAEDLQVVKFTTTDGIHLNSWYKPALANRPTILYLHGNAGHIGYRMPLVRQFLAKGFGVLLLEYRGYGGNQGKPTEQGLYQDAEAALNFLQQQDVAIEQIVLYGESLGTGVAIYMAIEHPVCAVILQSPYTSMTQVAYYHYPWIFIPPWDKFDSLSRISQLKSPLLILHGESDAIVPYQQARELFANANEPKQLVSIPGKGHNDLWDSTFAEKVIDFIGTYCF